MTKTKQAYKAPTTDLLVVRFEQGILKGSNWDNSTPNVNWGDDVDL